MDRVVAILNKLETYVWEMLYCQKTRMIYDGRISYNKNGNIEDLPMPEEIAALQPNPCGWGTGMEDSMIHGGMMLSVLLKKYELTKSENIKQKARELYLGIKHCASVSGVRGFLARSVSPIDGKSYYINSSRDQYTLVTVALCDYYDSSLSSFQEKKEIIEILTGFAERAKDNITPPHYNFGTSDGRYALVCDMWGNIGFHEAFRLPMIYLAAYHVSGEGKFWSWYEEICDEAFAKSENVVQLPYYFAYQQMFKSFEIALRYDMRDKYIEKIRSLIEKVLPFVKTEAESLLEKLLSEGMSFETLFSKWREQPYEMEHVGCWEYKFLKRCKAWREMEDLRNISCAAYMLSFQNRVSEKFFENYLALIGNISLEKHATGAPIYLLEGLMAMLNCNGK